MMMSPSSKTLAVYGMWRGGERKAEVVVFASGKCVVAWPSSVIVYDSEQAARDVHITHMGGRGESTQFLVEWASAPAFLRGGMDALQDDTENCDGASVNGGRQAPGLPFMDWKAPSYIASEDAAAYLHGYASYRWPEGA